jgi:hypothetical protein
MLGEANPLAEWEQIFDGSDVSGDINEFPPFDNVVAKCHAVRESTIALVDSLSEDDLDKPSANVPARLRFKLPTKIAPTSAPIPSPMK